MTSDEAFALLQIPTSASSDEITASYKLLAASYHPDRGGNDELMKSLNEAREIAIGSIQHRMLVPFEALNSIALTQAKYLADIQSVRESSQATYQQVFRYHTNRLRHLKRTAASLGIVLGGLVVISDKLATTISQFLPAAPTGYPSFALVLVLLIIVFGILYGSISSLEHSVGRIVEDLRDLLDDKSNFYALISSMVAQHELDPAAKWTEHNLVTALLDWVSSTRIRRGPLRLFSKRVNWLITVMSESTIPGSTQDLHSAIIVVGVRDFARLVIARGKEKGYLIESDGVKDGVLEVKYSLRPPNSPTK